jgi:Alpha-(1->3)-arabinofuranosyltransferase
VLLDFPSGPQAPNFSWFPVPSSGDLGNGSPMLALQTLLREIWEPIPDKLFLLAPIVVGGLGVYRLARTKLATPELAAFYGGTLYVINPFIYDRLVVGHLHFALAYGLLPWAASPLFDAVRTPTLSRAAVAGVWTFVLGLVSVHALGIYALLVVAVALVAHGRVLARVSFAAAWAGVALLLSAYWVLPALFVRPGRDVGNADLLEYETRPDGLAVIPTLLAMYGFWRKEFPREAQELPALYVLLIPILALAALGVVALMRSSRRLGMALAGSALVALLLAAGTAFPLTERPFRWFVTYVPSAGAYREPQKFLAVVVLALALFGAVGISTLGRRQATVAVVATAAVLLYGHAMFWGLSGRVELVRYPESWARADRIMAGTGDGRLLVLPWALYARWSFSEGRIVANPAPSFFSGREVLAGDDVNLPTIPTQSSDPFSYYVDDLLSRRERVERVGHLLAPLDVRFVAWTTDADFREYRMLNRAPDMELLWEGEELTLFENRAWRGDVLGLANGSFERRSSSLFGTPRELDATRQLVRSPPPVERAGDDFPPIARPFPAWHDVASTATPFVSTGERCTDGWRLGDQQARCHLGAVAAFRSPESESVLWRPVEGARVAGYAIALSTFAGLFLARIWLLRQSGRNRQPSVRHGG